MTKEEAAAIVENEIGDSMESRAKLLCASRTILNALEASERRVKELEAILPKKPDPLLVRVRVSYGGKTATGEVRADSIEDTKHVCGARGFGYEATDTCPRCELDKQAGDIAHAALAAQPQEHNDA